MSALAEHPSTSSIAASATLVFDESDAAADPLVEEPIEFDVLAPALGKLEEEPDEEYPAGSGPYGF